MAISILQEVNLQILGHLIFRFLSAVISNRIPELEFQRPHANACYLWQMHMVIGGMT